VAFLVLPAAPHRSTIGMRPRYHRGPDLQSANVYPQAASTIKQFHDRNRSRYRGA
jgi:hypothetical protein